MSPINHIFKLDKIVILEVRHIAVLRFPVDMMLSSLQLAQKTDQSNALGNNPIAMSSGKWLEVTSARDCS